MTDYEFGGDAGTSSTFSASDTFNGHSHRASEHGDIAEEAAKLFAAMQDWASNHLGDTSAHIATGAPECQWCPVCQVVSVLRGERPEVTEKIAVAAAAAFDAFRAIVDVASSTAPTGGRRVQRVSFGAQGSAGDEG